MDSPIDSGLIPLDQEEALEARKAGKRLVDEEEKVDVARKYTMAKSSNASGFSWHFQSNVAILLMIKNIVEATSVRVEGSTEDLENNR
jgi:hypothetical protein